MERKNSNDNRFCNSVKLRLFTISRNWITEINKIYLLTQNINIHSELFWFNLAHEKTRKQPVATSIPYLYVNIFLCMKKQIAFECIATTTIGYGCSYLPFTSYFCLNFFCSLCSLRLFGFNKWDLGVWYKP